MANRNCLEQEMNTWGSPNSRINREMLLLVVWYCYERTLSCALQVDKTHKLKL